MQTVLQFWRMALKPNASLTSTPALASTGARGRDQPGKPRVLVRDQPGKPRVLVRVRVGLGTGVRVDECPSSPPLPISARSSPPLHISVPSRLLSTPGIICSSGDRGPSLNGVRASHFMGFIVGGKAPLPY